MTVSAILSAWPVFQRSTRCWAGLEPQERTHMVRFSAAWDGEAAIARAKVAPRIARRNTVETPISSSPVRAGSDRSREAPPLVSLGARLIVLLSGKSFSHKIV